MISVLKEYISRHSRTRRAAVFFAAINPRLDAYVVDLGGGRGRHLARHYAALRNVCIADFNAEALAFAQAQFGYRTILMDGNERLPFADAEVDVMFCSSVVEHVTGPKDMAITRFKHDGRLFAASAWAAQSAFAAEVRRCSKAYFVQTPARYFIIETHSWLPMLGYLPSHWQWRIMQITNHFWPRKDNRPDWNLLSLPKMRALFPDAEIYIERFMGFPKSLIAIRKDASITA